MSTLSANPLGFPVIEFQLTLPEPVLSTPSEKPEGIPDNSLQLTPSFTELVTVGSDSDSVPTLSVPSAKPEGIPYNSLQLTPSFTELATVGSDSSI